MLHNKFRDNRPAGPEKIFEGFYHIWAWRPRCFSRRLHIKFGFDRPSGF